MVVTCPRCGNSTWCWLLVLDVGTQPGGGFLSTMWKLGLVAELVLDVETCPCGGDLSSMWEPNLLVAFCPQCWNSAWRWVIVLYWVLSARLICRLNKLFSSMNVKFWLFGPKSTKSCSSKNACQERKINIDFFSLDLSLFCHNTDQVAWPQLYSIINKNYESY